MGAVAGCTLEDLIRKNQIKLTKKQRLYLKLKRVTDLLCALIGLIVLSPILLIVAVMIKVDAPNEPVIFKQERIGQFGHSFWLYKFRSMKQGTPELGTNEFMDAEQYITKVGKFIRRTSLDELPQLWNVVCGSMSLVGPRPLLARENTMHFLRYYYGIYQMKPGITGLAQINGRDEMGDYEKARWDRTYAHNLSAKIDIEILWETVVKVLKREGIVDGATQKKALEENAYERTARVYDDEVNTVAHC